MPDSFGSITAHLFPSLAYLYAWFLSESSIRHSAVVLLFFASFSGPSPLGGTKPTIQVRIPVMILFILSHPRGSG